MSQQPEQNFNIDDSSFQQPQISQAGRDVHQTQNTNIYCFPNFAGVFPPRVVRPSNKEYFKSREILLNKVKQYWVRDLLEKSLHHKALIELGLEERLDAVERPSEVAQEDKSDFRQPLPKDKSNIDVFKQMDTGRTLLILGDPGAGKTTFLLRLAKNLIADAEENVSLPIPVVFNLSSWKSKRQNIANWLIQELNSKYTVSKSLAKLWIQNQQLLLLLDGLDEVKAEFRDACVQALNEFMKNYGETEMVICSRITDYELLSNRLSMQRGICIQSLTIEQINQYLDRAGNQLQAVKTLLETDTALQELVKSPLMLSIITLAYKDVAIEDLPQVDLVEEHRQHLFNSYIQRMFARRGTNKIYPEEKARNWLSWLAYKMSQDSQAIFSIEQIQPKWLETGQKLIYRIGVILFSSLIISIIAVLIDRFWFRNSWTIQIFYQVYIVYFIVGLTFGICVFINAYLNNKEEIILPTQSWRWSRKKAFKGIFFGIKFGFILGNFLALFSIFILIYSVVSGEYGIPDGLGNIYNIFYNNYNNRLAGLVASLQVGVLFVLLFQAIKTFFSNTLINLNIRLLPVLGFGLKKILTPGILVGIFIWPVSLIFPIITSLIIQLILIFLSFSFSSGFICSCVLGIIGAIVGVPDSVDIQKEVVFVNPVKKALANTIILTVIGGLIYGLIIGVLYFLSNRFPILKDFILFSAIPGIFLGQAISLACIQHLTLRLILYRSKYIAWNYTHFLEYATERIFLQKVGGGYIFVHRLLLDHFAALYQPFQLSLNTRLIPITKKNQVFSLFLIGTIILTTLLCYPFIKNGEKYFQNVLASPSRKIDYFTNKRIVYYSSAIQKEPKNAVNYYQRGLVYFKKEQYDLAIADYTQAIKLDPNSAKPYNKKLVFAYFRRGLVYKKQGSKDKAIEDFKKVLRLNNNNSSYVSQEASKQLQEISTKVPKRVVPES